MEDALERTVAPRNWKLTLAYDGTGFSGWQVQPGQRTIQGELQAALGRVTGERPLPQGSGRTDAGVHALGQVASFGLLARIPGENLLLALNRTLPEAIRVIAAQTVPQAFHARHSTIAKTYEYRVFQGAICPPVLARYVHACPWPMDLGELQASAKLLEGEHDFTSFAATDPDSGQRNEVQAPASAEALAKRGAVRTIFSSEWTAQGTSDGPVLIYQVRGNGFLHHMVRNLVGTMLDAGRGYTKADRIPNILAARSRATAGPTAPARGLFLRSVEYGGQNLKAADDPMHEADILLKVLDLADGEIERGKSVPIEDVMDEFGIDLAKP